MNIYKITWIELHQATIKANTQKEAQTIALNLPDTKTLIDVKTPIITLENAQPIEQWKTT